MPDLLTGFALAAVVLTLSALGSGLVRRAPISFPIIFLMLGVLLGPRGFGVLSLGPHDPTLEVIATLTLALVLFIDALTLRVDEVGHDWLVPALVLGPGAGLTILLVAVAAFLLFGTTLVQSLLLGAMLASTDPVVLRDVLRDERIPRAVRRTLGVEAGTNDIVVLPTILILLAISSATDRGPGGWLLFLLQLLVLGPLAGALVGGAGAWAMGKVDARLGVSQEYQALYGIGLVLAAYVAGVAVGGDGFLAAFAAGLTVTLLNFGLCDCFLDYGEITAEMTMLFAFILFGAVISTMTGLVPLGATVIFALVVIGVARPLAMGLVLRRATASAVGRRMIEWFGPRGLSSLLFALLAVQRGLPQGDRLLAIVGVVVMISVLLHGASATPLGAWYARRVAAETLPEEREASAHGLFEHEPSAGEAPRITVAQLADLLGSPNPPVLLDVRTRSQFAADPQQIPGSIRVAPDKVSEWAIDHQKLRDHLVVAYCT